ncbi:MAG: carbon-nitrogen hydrolase [Acidobacteriaceae bacterium]|nr:carbon-nitrogen hydrolase [Acidobacteriaceae bacterium]
MTSNSPFRVALIQMACAPSVSENLDHAADLVRSAARDGARLICLPELFRAQYFCQREDHALFALAEPIPGPSTARLAAIVREEKITLVASLFERRAPGLYHNTVAVQDHASNAPDQIVGTYRKMHIPDDPLFYEKFYFTPGDLGFRSIDTSAGPIGALICWDQWYPEAARITALSGAETLFYPTAIGWHPSEKAEFGAAQYDAWQTIQRAHAIANGVFVCSVNRVGHEHGDVVLSNPDGSRSEIPGPGDHTSASGLEFWGGSFIADPFGRILAQASHDKEEILTATLDPSLVELTRQHWPFLRDRRIDAYTPITRRFVD